MGLTRSRDWEQRLASYFADTASVEFDWGGNDCALWACAGIEAQTGVNPAAPFLTVERFMYRTSRGAAGAMKRYAGGGLVEVAEKITAQHGMEALQGLLYAGRGDLVLFDEGIGPALGLVNLDGCQVFSTGFQGRASQRLTALASLAHVRAWRVG